MNNDDVAKLFINSVDSWMCDGYFLTAQYLAVMHEQQLQIWSANLSLYPLAPAMDNSFHIQSELFTVGQTQRKLKSKKAAMRLLEQVTKGDLDLLDQTLKLTMIDPLEYYSESLNRGLWNYELHLRVTGTRRPAPSSLELAQIDNSLRRSTPPFDGLADMSSWLGLKSPENASEAPSISIRVGPPVDLFHTESGMANDKLTVTLRALTKFDVKRVGLAIRSGSTIQGRRQIADLVKWTSERNGIRKGVAEVDLPQAVDALAMLTIENATVRRQWFQDPTRARNRRYFAVQHFDRDLKMIRGAVFDSPDASRFEQGVSALLFMLGFSAAVHVETDAPDIVVNTPGGRLVVVECTTKISDFHLKAGKLIDRRATLSKALQASGHISDVMAVLVCRVPKDHISKNHAQDAAAQGVYLIANEELSDAFDRVKFPQDPDALITQAQATLQASRNSAP